MAKNPIPKRVLIVDDNDAVRRVLRNLFEPQKDFEICGEATDGRDAIDKAEQFHPDLIILDLSMPVMNGLQAARTIRRSNLKVSIILLTLHEQSIVDSEASAVGVDRLVSKADMIDLVRLARGIFTPEGPSAASQES